MDKGVNIVNSATTNITFIEEILSFNIKNLEQTDSIKLSQFIIALSQYLIYFKSQTNQTRAIIMKDQHFLDATVNQLLTDALLKEYKNKKTDVRDYIISTTEALSIIRENIWVLQAELIILEGQDKNISELIASFKRELTRRENELYCSRNH